MGLPEYLGARGKATSQRAAALAGPITELSAAQRGAMALLDACRAAQATELAETRRAMEETDQTLGAIVRELGNEIQAARASQAAYDQLERVETLLQTILGGTR